MDLNGSCWEEASQVKAPPPHIDFGSWGVGVTLRSARGPLGLGGGVYPATTTLDLLSTHRFKASSDVTGFCCSSTATGCISSRVCLCFLSDDKIHQTPGRHKWTQLSGVEIKMIPFSKLLFQTVGLNVQSRTFNKKARACSHTDAPPPPQLTPLRSLQFVFIWRKKGPLARSPVIRYGLFSK